MECSGRRWRVEWKWEARHRLECLSVQYGVYIWGKRGLRKLLSVVV